MKVFKLCFLLFLILICNTANAVVQTLRVAVVFDTFSTNYTAIERTNITNNIINNLNASFNGSGLGSYINFTLAINTTDSISVAGDTLDYLKFKYSVNPSLAGGIKAVRLTLHKIQKNYTADVVIGIVKPSNWLTTSICGTSVNIPNTSQITNTFPTVASLLKKGDDGILFLNARDTCLSRVYLTAHEVGHTFGLHHGVSVAIYNNDWSHYPTSILIGTGAGGYGKAGTSSYDYGTIMTAFNLGLSEAKKDNRFSDKTAYKCGTFDNQICGDTSSDAVSIIKANAQYYNQRGAWYTYW